MSSDTIVALSSGALPSAIAILRLSGPHAAAAVSRLTDLPEPRLAAFAILRDPDDGSTLDEAMVLRFVAPASATGEDVVELHVHGSRAVVDRLLTLLTRHDDVRLAEPGEFTRRALSNGKMDLIGAEALSDLLAAETEPQRRVALGQMRGGLSAALATFREDLANASAAAEAAIDYVGDDEETDRGEELRDDIARLRARIDELLELPDRRLLQDGIRTVLAGPVNAGKSSLFNNLVGFSRAITSEEEGTTRDTIEVPIRLRDTAFLLVDTAGQRSGAGAIEQEGIERSAKEVAQADLLLWLGDPEKKPAGENVILVDAKSDIGGHGQGISVSARTGDGIENLIDAMIAKASTMLPPPDGMVVNQRQRQLLNEISGVMVPVDDPVIAAESLRCALGLLDRLTGVSTLDDVLDRIFGRFCLGK
ncbi:tRNA uridine-5-carboxymethylaminomethyl(34) synthesis GTPase MnmE [Sphingomicrobium sediminis]|uniref:tRNA modification GTPase MnmE n=1 Tax=Sphingomicrobium sediminis TaxID=2950949 RepID=A0A9X2EMF7_9SPHN|nr:tRNA uridine-5-carboxymethylaminomethyl(34) synthesis GTPase MnmE [Sphingomicrobium sediminis]MCM8558079.1 tRNA uridine-5-carboxymethylaminomethyl(34) synthesis GTPase MnmE [Sphingomicrobium sediminis]